MRLSRVAALMAAMGGMLAGQAAWASEPVRPGLYIGATAIGSFADIDGIRSTGFTGTRRVGNDDDQTAALGALIGWRFERLPLRLEGEVHHRFRFDYDVRDQQTPSNYVGYETNLSTTAALANLKWELRQWKDFTPYLQGSFGWARNSADTERRSVAGTYTKHTTDTDNFAFGAGIGFLWDFARNWGLDLGYRYINLGEVDVKGFPTGETITADDLIAHDVQLSIIYRF